MVITMFADLISVIIPVYNVCDYIGQCLESVIHQTYSDIEIIVVDDGSTDGSGRICDMFSQKDKRIKVFHLENSGVSSARNFGIEQAAGKYIAFCDSDDIVSELWLESLYGNMKNTDADMSCCTYCEFYSENQPLFNVSEEIQIIERSDFFSSILFDERVYGYLFNKLFKRELICGEKHIRFMSDVYIWEDVLFVSQYLSKASSVVFSNSPLYGYRNNPESVLRSSFSYKNVSKLKVIKPVLELLEQYADKDISLRYWNYAMKTVAYTYKKLITTPIDKRNEFLKYTRCIYRDLKGQYRFNKDWSLKMYAYYFLLAAASRLNNDDRIE